LQLAERCEALFKFELILVIVLSAVISIMSTNYPYFAGNVAEKEDGRTIIFAGIFSGFMCLFILAFFGIMFRAKFNTWLNHKKRKNQPISNGTTDRPTVAHPKKPVLSQDIQARQRQRQPFRQQQPVSQKVSKSSGGEGGQAFNPISKHGRV
jgi:hypothetical protein